MSEQRRVRLAVLLLVGLAAAGGAALALHGPVPQDPDYHRFADTRTILGVPNFLDVVSNAPFTLVGVLGLVLLGRRRSPPAARVFFASVALVGLGSAWYHLEPTNDSLLWDRLPLVLAPVALLCLVIGERLSARAGNLLLPVLGALGIASVLYWYATEGAGRGDLRAYGFLQFYPAAGVVLLVLLAPPRLTSSSSYLVVVAWYGLAKLFEVADRPIFEATGFVSGHTLKHLAAAAAAWRLLEMLRRRAPLGGPREDVTMVVTGASAGIGREIARLAAPDVRRLVLVARRGERLDALAEELRAAEPELEVQVRACDLTDPEARARAFEGLEPDWLVNNAGFGDLVPFAEHDPERLAGMIRLNVEALSDGCRAVLPGMRERGRGRILNVASTAGFQPLPGFAAYAASKAYVVSLSEALAGECRGTGVSVTLLCPGVTKTEFFTAGEGFADRPLPGIASSAAAVARAGYHGMREGRRLVVPGPLNDLVRRLVPHLPRGFVLALAARFAHRR